MLKKYKKTLIITSIILLLPVLLGLFLWDQLPEQVPMHWNIEGEVDGWGSRAMLVFGLPALLLAVQWFGCFVTLQDPKRKGISEKSINLMLWICPLIGLVCFSMTYAATMGLDVAIEIITPLLLGILFVIIGNYMPKCKQNYSVGVKVPWTLNSEANWVATHRFAGWVWVIGGIVILLTAPLGTFWISFVLMLPMAFAPIIYSYLYFRKHEKGVSHDSEQ